MIVHGYGMITNFYLTSTLYSIIDYDILYHSNITITVLLHTATPVTCIATYPGDECLFGSGCAVAVAIYTQLALLMSVYELQLPSTTVQCSYH